MKKLCSYLVMLVVIAGCTTIPTDAFKSYTDAYDGVKTESEKLLVEVDSAFKLDAARKAAAEAKKNKSVAPAFPMEATGGDAGAPGADDVLARRQALELVSLFNTTLSDLAVGRSPDEVRSSARSLITGLNQFAGLIGLGASAAIPFGGEIGNLIGTLVQKLEEAHNRAQFVAAMREGAPIVSGIFAQLQKDANLVYRIRALDARSRSLTVRADMSNKVQEMTKVAATVGPPQSEDDQALLLDIQKRLTRVVQATGLLESDKLATSGSAGFSTMVGSQLSQTLSQLEESAKAYQAIVDEQNAFYAWIQSYKAMVGKANGTLNGVVVALDQPVDLTAVATELVGFVFQVRRDFEALRSARAAAARS